MWSSGASFSWITPAICGCNQTLLASTRAPTRMRLPVLSWTGTSGSPADFTDADGDGQDNWQEPRYGASPTDASSVLRLLSVQRTGTNGTVTWQIMARVSYFLERSMNLGASVLFTPLATNLPGRPGTTACAETIQRVRRRFSTVWGLETEAAS